MAYFSKKLGPLFRQQLPREKAQCLGVEVGMGKSHLYRPEKLRTRQKVESSEIKWICNKSDLSDDVVVCSGAWPVAMGDP